MKTYKGIVSVIKGFILWTLLACLTPFFSYGQTCSYRVLPLGDSITLGVGSSDMSSYRKELAGMLDVNSDYGFDFVGSLSNGPETFDNDHEGHSGWTAPQIAAGTFSWLKSNPAEIVLLHAGTNSLTTSTSGIEAILNEIDSFSPDTWVLLALIINQDPYNATVSSFNQNLLTMAQNRIANGDKIIVVDQESALIYPEDLADPLHPNDEGYRKMAQVWETALEPLVNDLCNGPPHIIGSAVAPKTLGIVTVPYTYQVKAYGNPALLYELTVSPEGMTIDPATGLINWTPITTGSFDVTVRVSNNFGSDTQSFVIVVRNPDRNELVIDDGQTGTTPVGRWVTSAGANPYGVRSLYIYSTTGSYTYEAVRYGLQEVYLWWTEHSTRSTNVPIQIYDGEKLSTVYVNQILNGGQWNFLGSYYFSGVARVKVLATSSTLTTCADAVRFMPVASIPQITSTPITSGMAGIPYTYRVEAIGAPVLAYQLLDPPEGMTIDPATGLINWTPAMIGSFDITVTVSNNLGSDTQRFTIVVTEPGAELVIDNGEPGTYEVGLWRASVSGTNPYGTDSLFSKTVSGTYTFEAELSGIQEVYLWWTQALSRSTRVPVRIYDGTTLLTTIYVDQTANGGQWNLLGSYSFSGVARVVIVSTSSTLTTCADAVRFMPVASIPQITSTPITSGMAGIPYTYRVEAIGAPVLAYQLLDPPEGMTIDPATGLINWTPAMIGSFDITVTVSNNLGSDTQRFTIVVTEPGAELVIDNGEPGTYEVGLWRASVSGTNPYGTDSLFSKTVSGTYTFEAELSGIQEVYLWWTQALSRSTRVPVRIYDGTTLLTTIYVDQTANGGQWNLLGSYSFSGVARVVIVSTSSTLTTCADAVRFMPVQ